MPSDVGTGKRVKFTPEFLDWMRSLCEDEECNDPDCPSVVALIEETRRQGGIVAK